MKGSAPGSFGARLKALREAAGFTQEELATIAGLSVHAVSALERGQRRRPQRDTIRALSAALDLTDPIRATLIESARPPAHDSAVGHARDVCALQPRRSASFAHETTRGVEVGRYVAEHQLDGDGFVELKMARREHDAHTTLAQDALDAVLPRQHLTHFKHVT